MLVPAPLGAAAPPELDPVAPPVAAEPPEAAELLGLVAEEVVAVDDVVVDELGAAMVPVGTVKEGLPDVLATVGLLPQAATSAPASSSAGISATLTAARLGSASAMAKRRIKNRAVPSACRNSDSR